MNVVVLYSRLRYVCVAIDTFLDLESKINEVLALVSGADLVCQSSLDMSKSQIKYLYGVNTRTLTFFFFNPRA